MNINGEMIITSSDVIDQHLVTPPARDGYVFELSRVIVATNSEQVYTEIDQFAIASQVHFGILASPDALTAWTDYEEMDSNVLFRSRANPMHFIDSNLPSESSFLDDDPVFLTSARMVFATRAGAGFLGTQVRIKYRLELEEKRLTSEIRDLLLQRQVC